MRLPFHVLLLGSLLFALTPTCETRAEAPSSEAVVESRREQAKVTFKRGSELYEAGQYRQAAAAFMTADKLAPSAALSFNIALTYDKLDDTSGALRWYRDYLRRSPRAPNATSVEARVTELSSKLGRTGQQQLTIVSTPDGASLQIDGRPVGVTPFTGELPLGPHRVRLELSGYRDAERELVLGPSAARELSVTLDAAPRPDQTANSGKEADTTLRDSDGGRRFGVAPWLFVGGGLASLGGALGFEFARRADESDAQDANSQISFKDETEAMQRHQTTARVLAGIGGALFVTGGVMLLFNTQAPAAPRVALACTPRGCNASAQGRF